MADKGAITRIQAHIDAIYDLDVPERATDFLIERGVLEHLEAEGVVPVGLSASDEQVLVLGGEEEVSLAVWLSERVRAGLQGPRSLQVHCHATEAVSHFLMLVWSAREGRSVRLFDLELQAEIDKTATALLEDLRVGGGGGGPRLLRRMFSDVELDPRLSEAERQRYLEAHKLAAGYAGRLLELLGRGPEWMVEELRSLYRLPGEGKVRRIARAA